MLNVEYKRSISEVLDILKHMDKIYTEKISDKFKRLLEENQEEGYVSNLDYNKKLEEMNLSENTKNLLGVIYLNFWCDDDEAQKFKNILKENQKKFDKKSTAVFKYNDSKSIINKNEEDISNEMIIKESSENISIFKKIINFIKSFFNLK